MAHAGSVWRAGPEGAPEQVERVGGTVRVAFTLAAEYPGEELQRRIVVVREPDQPEFGPAGEATLDGGLRGGVGGDEGAMDQTRAQQRQAVVDAVDFGDDP